MGVSEDEIAKINVSVEAEIEDCVRFADESPEPDESLIEAFNYA
jgi:TPP-dependent pyruvate/acetoin dehydrogenase alpha subunit